MICGSYINVHRLPSNNYMPCRIIFLVKLLFYKCCNVLQTILGFEGNTTLSNQAKPNERKIILYIYVCVCANKNTASIPFRHHTDDKEWQSM